MVLLYTRSQLSVNKSIIYSTLDQNSHLSPSKIGAKVPYISRKSDLRVERKICGSIFFCFVFFFLTRNESRFFFWMVTALKKRLFPRVITALASLGHIEYLEYSSEHMKAVGAAALAPYMPAVRPTWVREFRQKINSLLLYKSFTRFLR